MTAVPQPTEPHSPDTVSCIIPTHGRPDFLKESVESVLSQSRPPIEVIVVSDDAEVRTREIVDSLAAESDVPIRYVDNSGGPGGASSSRNAGARVASGSLLAFLDDDDLWETAYLEQSVALLCSAGVDCVVSWLMMFRGELRVPGLTMNEGLQAKEVAAINPGFIGSNFVIKAEAFWKIGGFDDELRVINDGDFIYRYLQAGGTYRVNATYAVLQRKHSSGQLTAATEMRAAGLEAYVEKHRQTLSLADRRYMRLAINRIRYHAASSWPRKLGYLVAGALNSSPKSVAISIRGWKQRPVWRSN
ncbi:glycosyltransferase family 2 protein [Herbiconiux sp. VKM Ac-1786]|uniref:glycosyltransferase family A protein n=1 Tax=Herbiconiux sp. VKM Ac-1786 TaxID=2783824 RepID=UPI00188DC599|nr:glycosyltransferase family A protein [Herbiconiux sp. VKM Ac-1786]MBF4572940.1 glycosyltransferase family 2 protein [Herbiconiux sp. VKM Ac-1786]